MGTETKMVQCVQDIAGQGNLENCGFEGFERGGGAEPGGDRQLRR